MADVQQHEQQVGFLRSTAQRAGQLALAAPRYAIRNSLPLTVQQRLNDWSTYLVGGGHETANEATSSALANGVTTGSASTGPTSRGGGGGTAAASQNAGNLYLPSPVTYLTSAYLFTSLALAFLLHRIHHLVPPRQSLTHANAHAHAHNRGGTGLHRVMQPAVQIGCRLPGIVLLVKAVALLALALALARGHSLEWLAATTTRGGGGDNSTGWILSLVQSAARATLRAVDWSSAWSGGRSNFLAFLKPAAPTATTAVKATIAHSSLLWQVYLAICMTVSCESFVRALSDDLPHAQHQFNLLSFSFLLHIHAGPNPPAHNPAKYAELYTYLTVTMLEILALQVSYIAPHVPGLKRLDAKYRAWVVSPPVNVNAGPAAVHRALAARVYRLPVTTVFSLAAQYFALRSWSRLIWPHGSSAAAAMATTTTLGQDAALTMAAAEARLNDVEDFGTVWLNKIPEVTLEVIVGTSVALKALAALIRGEELSMENLIGPSGLSPQPEEDYAVALIKYATHLLSTTRLSGLAHELSPLEVLPNSVATSLETLGFLEPPPCDSDECPVHGPENRAAAREAREIAENGGGQEVVLQRNGDVVFWDLVALDGHGNDLPGQEGGLRRRVVPGLTNEIRRVSVESPYGAETDENGYAADGSWTGQPSSGGGGGGGGFFPFSRRMGHVEGERKSALWRLIGVCARIVMFLTWRTYRLVRHVTRKVLAMTIGWKRDEWEMEQRWVAFERMRQRGQDAPAGPIRPDRIIRDLTPGMTLVDVNNGDVYVVPDEDDEEDDAEWLPEPEHGDEADDSEGDEDAASDNDDGAGPSSPSLDGDELQNPLVLYSDLSRPQPVRSQSGSLTDGRHDSAPSPEDLAPYLLAHHLSSSSTGPLTRRRYRGLVPAGTAPPDGVSALSTAIEHRRGEVLQTAQARANGGDVAQWMEDEREKWREGRSRFCVVCTVEERTVVLWPCRCLCLCESCRAALAERTTAAVFDDGSNAGGASGNQLCPTCRSPVQGFSRIFTP